jgi:hypothetical protein
MTLGQVLRVAETIGYALVFIILLLIAVDADARDDRAVWDPASGPVDAYIVQYQYRGPPWFEANRWIVLGITDTNEFLIVAAERLEPFRVRVAAINRERHERGPWSEASIVRGEPWVMCPPDWATR